MASEKNQGRFLITILFINKSTFKKEEWQKRRKNYL